MNWTDSTSYSRDDKERVPVSWSTEIGGLRITVTCGHIHHKPDWVMHCFNIGIDTLPITATNAEDAKLIAIKIVKSRISNWYESIRNL